MKKEYLTEMETEKRNKLIEKNKKLINMLVNNLYEDNCFRMELETNDILGKDWHQYIDYHDNYSSFYLRVKDWRKFIENVDADYLNNDAFSMYKLINEKIKQSDDVDYYSTTYDVLIEEIDEGCSFILDNIEEDLHMYEKIPSEDDAIQYADEMEQLNDYYIEIHDDGFCDGVIRKDIAYTETYI